MSFAMEPDWSSTRMMSVGTSFSVEDVTDSPVA